jgi:chromosome segregation ATPase
LGDVPEVSVVATLKSEIQDLQKRVAANLVVISTKETEISNLEKDISDRTQLHESTISDRDATIASLGKKVSELQTEVNTLRESSRAAEKTAAKLTLQLQVTEAFVTELETDADVSKTKLGVLETSNANLLHDQETLKLDLELAKAKCIETEITAEDVRNHAKTVSDELHSLKISQDEQISKIESLVDSLARTSGDAQALRENAKKLEAEYKAEIQKKDDIRHNLEIQVKQNGSRIAQLSADLQTVGKSVEDMKIQVAEANKKAADAESLNEKLGTELSLKDGAVQQYQKDLANAQVEVATWTTKHANDTTTLSSTISDLRNALATANGNVERLTSEAQELEKGLGYLKTSKEADEATISSLRASFMKLRQSQLRIFGEFEQEVCYVLLLGYVSDNRPRFD